jgi:O-antigen/teichoic acid export membrane protein
VTLKTSSLSALWRTLHAKVIGRKFVHDVGILTIANFAGAALSFFQGILLARWLGPELYGVAALVMSYPSLIYTFFDARSAEASVKYLSEFHARGDRERILAMCKLGYVVDIIIAALMFFTVLVTAEWAAHRLTHRPEAADLIVVYATAFLPRALAGTSYAVLATLGRFPLIAFLDMLTTVVRVMLTLWAVLLGLEVYGVVWGNAVAMALAGLGYATAATILISRTWRALPWQGRWQTLIGRRWEILRFFIYNDLNALLGMIPKQLDVMLLGYFRNPTEVGYYKLARSLAAAVMYLVRPLQSVVYPELARLWGGEDREALFRQVRRLAMHVGAPLGFAVLGGTLLVPLTLPVLVGHSYRPTVAITQLLLIGSAVWLAFFWLRPLYFAEAQVAKWTAGISSYSIMFLLLGILTVQKWGSIGITLSLVIVTVLFHIGMGVLIYETNRGSRKPL